MSTEPTLERQISVPRAQPVREIPKKAAPIRQVEGTVQQKVGTVVRDERRQPSRPEDRKIVAEKPRETDVLTASKPPAREIMAASTDIQQRVSAILRAAKSAESGYKEKGKETARRYWQDGLLRGLGRMFDQTYGPDDLVGQKRIDAIRFVRSKIKEAVGQGADNQMPVFLRMDA